MMKALVDNKVMYALDAKSGMIGECPHCGNAVRARIGEINIEHWAHINKECPYITEKDTGWHIYFKKKFEKKGYTTEKRFGNFIADAYNEKSNTVIEFQHSPITPSEILSRCKYYNSINKNIKWIIDYTDKYKRRHIELIEKISNNEYYYKFKILWNRKSYNQGIYISEKIINSEIPIYFNIISNLRKDEYTQLRVDKKFEEYESDKSIIKNFRYRNYWNILNDSFSDYVLADLYYDSSKAVLLRPQRNTYDGKYGIGNLLFE